MMTDNASARLVALLVLGLLRCAYGAEPVVLEGRAATDGNDKAVPEFLSVWQAGNRLAYCRTDKRGSFKVELHPAGGDELVITAENGAALVPGSRFFVGGHEVPPKSNGKLVVKFRLAKIKRVKVIATYNGKPLQGVKVDCDASAVLTTHRAAGKWKGAWDMQTDEKGVVSVLMPEGVESAYRLSVIYERIGYRFYTGTLNLTGKQALSAKAPPEIATRAKVMNLVVALKWDPAFSKERLDPFVAPPIGEHYINISGPEPRYAQVGRASGEARHIDVPTGEHRLELSRAAAKHYSITRNSGVVRIPAKGPVPVRHTVFIMPKNPRFVTDFIRKLKARGSRGKPYQGVVVDKSTQKPLHDAVVTSSLDKRTTDKNGRFTVRIPDRQNISLQVAHSDYHPAVVPLTESKGIMLKKYQLERYPRFSGKVLRMKTSKPIKWASVLAIGPVKRKFKTDRFGRFSAYLAPGRYTVRVEEEVKYERPKSKGNQEVPWGPLLVEVLTWEGKISVPKEGLVRRITVSQIARLNVKVKISPEAAKQGRPAYISLLRAHDLLPVCPMQPLEDPEAAPPLFAVPGSYKIALYPGGMFVGFGADVEVKGKGAQDVRAMVKRWLKCTVLPDGRIKVQSDGKR